VLNIIRPEAPMPALITPHGGRRVDLLVLQAGFVRPATSA
jgi:hypothetical protein